jgi:hypothetical protein
MSNNIRYIFDSDALINLFLHYPTDIFKQLWTNFDDLLKTHTIISSSEVFKEIGGKENELGKWAKQNKAIFLKPTMAELVIVQSIFQVPHFQNNIKPTPSTAVTPQADPFIIAQAKNHNCTLITDEKYKPNAAKIPNICNHFKVTHANLHGFFRAEGWSF